MNRHEKALELFAFGGVIPAIPLVLNKDREYNENGQRLLTRYYLEAGVTGIAIAVHTTQFEIREPQFNLFERVIKTVSDEIGRFESENNKIIVKICGTCGKIKQAENEAEIAKKYGFDAVLLSPGGLSDMNEDYLVERTKAVAAKMPVIGFYLQNSVGGRVFSYNYWKQVAAIENVIGIKCASFNRYTTVDVARAVALSKRADKITLYTGNDDNIVVDLLTKYKFTQDNKEYSVRFKGGLLGHWSVWTNTVVKLFNEIQKTIDSNFFPQELLTLAAEITDANAALFDYHNNYAGCICGIHEILRRQGIIDGIWCLNPNEKLSDGQIDEIDRVCKMYPHLTDDRFILDNLSKWKNSIK